MTKNDTGLQSIIEDLQLLITKTKKVDLGYKNLIDENLILKKKYYDLSINNDKILETNTELKQYVKQLDEEKRKTEQLYLKIIKIISENYFDLLEEIDKKDSGFMHNCLINNIMSTMQNLSDYHCSIVDFDTHEDSFEYHLVETDDSTMNGKKTIIYPAIVSDDKKTLYKGLTAIYKYRNETKITSYNVYIKSKKGSEQSIPLKKDDEESDWFLYSPEDLIEFGYVDKSFFDNTEGKFETWNDELDDSALDINKSIRKNDLKRDLYIYPVYKIIKKDSISDSNKSSNHKNDAIAYDNNNCTNNMIKHFTIQYYSGTPNNIMKECTVEEGSAIPQIKMDFDNYDNHSFDGWLFSKDNTAIDEKSVVLKDVQLIGKWKPIEYQIVVHCIDENNNQLLDDIVQSIPYDSNQISIPSIPGYYTPDPTIENIRDTQSPDPIIITKIYKKKKGHISVQKGLKLYDSDNKKYCSSVIDLPDSKHYSISFEGDSVSEIASLTLQCVDSYDIQYFIDAENDKMIVTIKHDTDEPYLTRNRAVLPGHFNIDFNDPIQNTEYDMRLSTLKNNNGILECTYTLKDRNYLIQWTWNGKNFQELVKHNEIPKGPDMKKVTRPPNGDHYFLFSCWKPEVKAATRDMIYNAHFIEGNGSDLVLRMIDEGKTKESITAYLSIKKDKLDEILKKLQKKNEIKIEKTGRIKRINNKKS